MGAGQDDLVVLVEDPDAVPAGRHAGLYHFALLHPSRTELARAVGRLVETRTAIDGASDHGVSEAIYLPDPDGNGIELYADRPRDAWPPVDAAGRITMFTEPLDLRDLMALVTGELATPRASEGLVVGHVHLHVGDTRQALGFYGDVVGFDLMAVYPGAVFMAAGGYHHHLGANAWRGQGVPPAPANAVGLRRWTVVLDGPGSLARLRERLTAAGVLHDASAGEVVVVDPWEIPVVFREPGAA
jgi:catechol 2,3-dioxygenase